VTAHIALAFGLAARPPRWHGLVALLVVPLAPYWGYRENMRARAVLWAGALATYAAARVAGQMTGG
jgi:hypothetical protein